MGSKGPIPSQVDSDNWSGWADAQTDLSLLGAQVILWFLSCLDSVKNTFQLWSFSFEPRHDKTNNMACVPGEDSDQPGHSPSLIRVFAVCMKKHWVLGYPLSAQRRLIRLGRWPCWSESSLGTQSFCWFWHVAHFTDVWRYVIKIPKVGTTGSRGIWSEITIYLTWCEITVYSTWCVR